MYLTLTFHVTFRL